MKQIAQDVYLIEGLRVCNVYLLVSDASLTLVDAGMAGDVDRIVAQIEGEGYTPSELQSIVVTHAHTDHTGGIAELVRRFGAQVIAHREEVPYIEGVENLPIGSALQRVMKWLADRLPGEGRGIEVARGVVEGEKLDVLDGLQVIHTPGHTPGSICLYQEDRRVLFCGDLLFNGHPFTGRGGLRYAPRALSVDPEEAERSAQRLLGLQVRVLCVGHGEPILKEASAKIEELLGVVRA